MIGINCGLFMRLLCSLTVLTLGTGPGSVAKADYPQILQEVEDSDEGDWIDPDDPDLEEEFPEDEEPDWEDEEPPDSDDVGPDWEESDRWQEEEPES